MGKGSPSAGVRGNMREFQVSWSERSRRCQEGVADPEDGETGALRSYRASFITLDTYTSSCTIEFKSQCFSYLFEDYGRDGCLKKDGFKGQCWPKVNKWH